MSWLTILFLAGLTALAFIVVSLRGGRAARPLRVALLVVAAAIVAYTGWILISALAR